MKSFDQSERRRKGKDAVLTNEKKELAYLLIVSHGAVGIPNVAKCPTHAGPVTQLPADIQVRL